MAVLTETGKSVKEVKSQPLPSREQIAAYLREHEELQQDLAQLGVDGDQLVDEFEAGQRAIRSGQPR